MRKTSIALALLLATTLIAGGVAVASASSSPGDASSGNYTVEELRQSGTQYENSPDSARIAEEQIYWVVHWPADKPRANPGEDDKWSYLSPGETVQRNAVYLRSIRSESSSETVTVNIVYWQEGEEEVKTENGTVTRTVPTNVVTEQKEVTLERGWPSEEITLRQHDEPVQVTMWIEGKPEARWTFQHHSIATTQSAGISSEGDYLIRVLQEFVGPTVIGLFVAGFLVKRALDRAGVGPMWGYAPWLLLVGLGALFGMAYAFSNIAELLVHLPPILAVLTVLIATVVILETYTKNVSRAVFFRPELDEGTSPTGEQAVDIIDAEMEEERIVKQPDGTRSVVRKGPLAFLSRCFGGAARLEGGREIKTEIQLSNSKWDEMYVVSPSADKVIDYEPEGWTLSAPDWTRQTAAAAGFCTLGAVGLAYSNWGTSVAIGVGLAIAGWTLISPEDGHARIDPAPAHLRSALGSMLFLAEEVDDAETIDEARERLVEAKAQSEKDVEAALERQDSTLVETMFDTDVDRALEDIQDSVILEDDETDEEVPADD